MKQTGWILALLFGAALLLHAQVPGSSIALSATTNCPPPALGLFSFCKTTGGGAVTYTDDGSAYAKANLTATPGPTGPTGPQGPAGAQGPTGPTWTTCTGVTWTPTGVSNGIVSGTLTVTSANCK